MFISWQAMSYLVKFLVEKLDINVQNSLLFVNVSNFVALYCVGLPLLWLIIRTIPEKETPEPCRPRLKMTVWRFPALLVFCFGITYIVNFISTFIMAFIIGLAVLPQTAVLQPVSVASSYGRELVISVFFTACVPGLLEEYVFRYLLYKKMRGSGDLPYILFSGIAFGLFHGNFSQMFFAMAIGCIYAWIYTKTNVIWYSVGLHFLNNLFAAFILPLLTFSLMGLFAILLFVLSAIIVAIVLGISHRKKVWAGLSGPSEEGWPQKKEKGWQRKMQFKMPTLAYAINLKMMEYPPYSTNKTENYEIVRYLQQQENKQTLQQQTQVYPQLNYAVPQYNVWQAGAGSTQVNTQPHYWQQNNYAGATNNGVYTSYAWQGGYYGSYGFMPPQYAGGNMQAYGLNTGNAGYYNPVRYNPSRYQPKRASIAGFLFKNLGSILFIIAALISSIVYFL